MLKDLHSRHFSAPWSSKQWWDSNISPFLRQAKKTELMIHNQQTWLHKTFKQEEYLWSSSHNWGLSWWNITRIWMNSALWDQSQNSLILDKITRQPIQSFFTYNTISQEFTLPIWASCQFYCNKSRKQKTIWYHWNWHLLRLKSWKFAPSKRNFSQDQ